MLSFWLRISLAVWISTGIGFGVRGLLPEGPPLIMGAIAGGLAALLVVVIGMAFRVPEISEVTGKVSRKVRQKLGR